MIVSHRTNEPVIDYYPIRRNIENEIAVNPDKSRYRNLILFSLVYFLCGTGISIYGLLYPTQARRNGLSSCIYGAVIGTSYFICILVYPFACHMVSNVSSRNTLSISIIVIGACRILFGTLKFISKKIPFIALSFAIQVGEGIGISILIASTIAKAETLAKDPMQSLYCVQASLILGLLLGPIGGQVVKEELGFDILFYIIGVLTILSCILIVTLLRDSEEQVTYTDMPIIYWIKDKRMLIYFVIIFASFNYVGFLSTSLKDILKQFHLNNLYAALLFSISPLVYILSAPGWIWLIKKGFNNVMLVFIGALTIFASLVLLGPAPYTALEASSTYVCCALVLEGLGIACKSVCVLDASEQDLSQQKKYTEIQQKLIFPTVFFLGASLGYVCGSLTAGFAVFYIGYRKATLPLFGLEICTGITAVVFAMNRNYVSKRRRREASEEKQPIIRT